MKESDLTNWLSTGDTGGANDNRITVTVVSGQTSNNNDFLDVLPSYTLDKELASPLGTPAEIGDPVEFVESENDPRGRNDWLDFP